MTEFVSLDGVYEDPGGVSSFKQGGWSFKINLARAGTPSSVRSCGPPTPNRLDRVTYEGFAAAWPEWSTHPASSGRR
jgi:hypothetical protein